MAKPNGTTRGTLSKLVSDISQQVSVLEKYLEQNGLPEPTIGEGGLTEWKIPPTEKDLAAARVGLLDTIDSLRYLALGPTEVLTRAAHSAIYDTAVLRAIVHFKIPSAVPLGGEISFKELSVTIGLNEAVTTRILRYATAIRLFSEHRPGFISHTSVTAQLASNAIVRGNVTHRLVTIFPALAKLDETIQQYPKTGSADADPLQTPFQVGWGTDQMLWDWLEEEGRDFNRNAFHDASQAVALAGGHIAEAKIWKDLQAGSTVVDVGGSEGHISVDIARVQPGLKFVIQDRAAVVTSGEANLPDELRDRFTFMAHDFMKPQPVAGDIYFLRAICHNWPDALAAVILRNLVPAMKPGAKIVVMDAVLEEPGTLPKYLDKLQRALDLEMMVALNARERTLGDWKALFRMADERLEVVEVWTPEGSAHSMIIATLKE